ncbi:MAG: hypothetical protein EHM79_05485 [Geobacter sp.]|nr:MAG: hypothetical protein EHM79_05485 [Geobacter sp.]
MFEQLTGDVRNYAVVLMNRSIKELEIQLERGRKLRYWGLTIDETKIALRAAISEKQKMAIS